MNPTRRELLALGAAPALSGQSPRVREASGVFRAGQHLLIADDSAIGEYFRLTLPRRPQRFMLLNDLRPVRIPFKNAGLAIDLESIGVLADGRVAALSERLRSLIGDEGILAEYDPLLSEVGKRGLEGLAIRPLPNRASRIAVLWEGGYPDEPSLPGQFRREASFQPLLPLVLVHDLAAHARAGRVSLGDAQLTIELQVPRPEGAGRGAQRFRAPELVWTHLGGDWGFIVLLSSQNALPMPTYEHHILQRFNLEGQRVGAPIDLGALAPERHARQNWEGLCWFEPGRSLLAVHEHSPQAEPAALIVDLPADWRFDPAP
jgi:hypothetical protein